MERLPWPWCDGVGEEEIKDLKKIRKKVKTDSDYGFEWTPISEK